MEDEETLHSDALISQLAGVGRQRSTMSLLNHVVVSAVVVGCILLPRQELFWVEQLVMNPRTDIRTYIQVDLTQTLVLTSLVPPNMRPIASRNLPGANQVWS